MSRLALPRKEDVDSGGKTKLFAVREMQKTGRLGAKNRIGAIERAFLRVASVVGIRRRRRRRF